MTTNKYYIIINLMTFRFDLDQTIKLSEAVMLAFQKGQRPTRPLETNFRTKQKECTASTETSFFTRWKETKVEMVNSSAWTSSKASIRFIDLRRSSPCSYACITYSFFHGGVQGEEKRRWQYSCVVHAFFLQ